MELVDLLGLTVDKHLLLVSLQMVVLRVQTEALVAMVALAVARQTLVLAVRMEETVILAVLVRVQLPGSLERIPVHFTPAAAVVVPESARYRILVATVAVEMAHEPYIREPTLFLVLVLLIQAVAAAVAVPLVIITGKTIPQLAPVALALSLSAIKGGNSIGKKNGKD